MDLTYNPEQRAYREAVRYFVVATLAPIVDREHDLSRPFTRQDIASLRARIAGHAIATEAPLDEYGRLDLIRLGIFIEELSRLNVSVASLATAIFFPVWDLSGLLRGRQKELYAHLFEPGEIVSIAMSEPDAGSDAAGIGATARRDGDGWILDGTKSWASHAQIASGMVVSARNAETGAVSLFIVDRERQPYQVEVTETLGWTGSAICEVRFDQCRLPAEAELAPGEGGLRTAFSLFEQARIKIVFMAVGLAQAALDLAVDHARTRQQFGQPIGSFQLIQGLLAEMAIDVEAARMLGYRVASEFMAGEDARMTISIAKAFASEAVGRVTSKCIQVHGAKGLTRQCAAERYFRDARMFTIPDGTTEIHKLTIGRRLTGISAVR